MADTPSRDPRRKYPQPPFHEPMQPHPGKEAPLSPPADHGETSYKGSNRLHGRVALITGGDSGIGRAVAIAFAREGCDVAIAYLNERQDAETTKQWVEKAGRKALTIAGDLAGEAACRAAVQQTVERFGRIDILVNNAAYQGHAAQSIEDLTADRLERTFNVNVLAMFHLVRFALPHMPPGGTIINVASIQAYQPNAEILDYASTKGAVVTFTKGLAQELIGKGIRVNAVAPGPVWTPLIPQSFDEDHVSEFGKSSPMGRPAQPAELAPVFVFLASDDASYVNGEIMGVTGGEILA